MTDMWQKRLARLKEQKLERQKERRGEHRRGRREERRQMKAEQQCERLEGPSMSLVWTPNRFNAGRHRHRNIKMLWLLSLSLFPPLLSYTHTAHQCTNVHIDTLMNSLRFWCSYMLCCSHIHMHKCTHTRAHSCTMLLFCSCQLFTLPLLPGSSQPVWPCCSYLSLCTSPDFFSSHLLPTSQP